MLFLHLLPGLLVLLIGLTLKLRPPKRINWFYGFRTHYSMRSLENWREANRYYARLLLGVGFLSTLAGWLFFLLLASPASMLALVGLMLLLLMGSILMTNKHLKQKYGDW
ncbi:SdpI family protein [Pontibacter litorisediminis]|uniref:SdpI family protein n=1 Tax=Pontibacter litorisediminis TaxID=1846260 RepID=UPI0023EB103C|nr:SdpI family protein [Pontibacter litorisediminis]